MAIQRRTAHRLCKDVWAIHSDEKRHGEGYTRDVSVRGCRLLSSGSAKVGRPMTLTLELGPGQMVTMPCRALWKRYAAGRWEMGVRFEQTEEALPVRCWVLEETLRELAASA